MSKLWKMECWENVVCGKNWKVWGIKWKTQGKQLRVDVSAEGFASRAAEF